MFGVIDVSDMMVLLETSRFRMRFARSRAESAGHHVIADPRLTEPLVKAAARRAGRSAAKSLDDGEASRTIPRVVPKRDQRLLAVRLDARRPRTVRERRVEGRAL